MQNCRLQQVWTERSGSHEQISIVLGEAPESEHVTHIVSEPRRVRFQETESGAHEGLEIEGDEGTTVLHFRWPKRPETPDSAPPESLHGDASANAGGKVRS